MTEQFPKFYKVQEYNHFNSIEAAMAGTRVQIKVLVGQPAKQITGDKVKLPQRTNNQHNQSLSGLPVTQGGNNMVEISEDMMAKEGDFPDSITPDEVKEAKEMEVEITRAEIVEVGDYDNPSVKVKKPVLHIKSGEDEKGYWPNKTSVSRIVAQHGKTLEDWIGKKITLLTALTNVRGSQKDVIYVKE